MSVVVMAAAGVFESRGRNQHSRPLEGHQVGCLRRIYSRYTLRARGGGRLTAPASGSIERHDSSASEQCFGDMKTCCGQWCQIF